MVASVEVDEEIVAMLACGMSAEVEILRGDRAKLAEAAFRALRHLGRFYEKTGDSKSRTEAYLSGAR
jgi:hypothetical protein